MGRFLMVGGSAGMSIGEIVDAIDCEYHIPQGNHCQALEMKYNLAAVLD
jgi:hypothetical protein